MTPQPGLAPNRLGACLALALLLPVWAAAQPTFQAQVNATRVGLEDQVQLTIVLANAEPKGDITMPTLTGLEVVAGPSVSTQISFINGAVSQSRSYTFLLRPTALGQATVGPARVELADGERRTDPITIEVVEGSVLPRRQPPMDPFEEMFRRDPFEEFFGRRHEPAAAAQVVLEAEVSRRQVYVGEPVLLTVYLLTQTAVSGLDVADPPRFSGFWVEELPRPEEPPQGNPVTRDGEVYRRFAVLKRLLFPTRAGSLTIPALSFRVAVPRRVGFFVGPGPASTAVLSRATAPLELTVLPIPASEAEYGGAVGSFRATASLDRSQVQLGEAVRLRVALAGRGNLKWVDRPPQLQLAGAKVYPPRVVDNLRVTLDGVEGERAWEVVVVPEAAGELRIPPLSFPFFDPTTQRVRRTETPPLAVTVHAPPTLAAQGVALDARASPTLALRADLPASPLAGEPGPEVVAAVALATLLGHGLLWAGPQLVRRRRGGSDRRHRSLRAVVADLRRARQAGLSKEAAAALIERALVEVFGDLDRLDPDAPESRRLAWEVVREARFVRYAPQLGEYGEKLEDLARRAEALVRRQG